MASVRPSLRFVVGTALLTSAGVGAACTGKPIGNTAGGQGPEKPIVNTVARSPLPEEPEPEKPIVNTVASPPSPEEPEPEKPIVNTVASPPEPEKPREPTRPIVNTAPVPPDEPAKTRPSEPDPDMPRKTINVRPDLSRTEP